ncbi:hypothetical protein SAMD00019534_056060 [Acytostelium subglobosum LB1]|uniref:hypothetical protein n=1 Tax=Acytostelium subglobosum LB1 TaxID=1410327 RepID=UPI000644915B|nr:hypothetical protein SAMD00019534_056060 [Acytostelium subglobosum LB1]GAM22431.1 hypothetical protein SAMD00019534_056060 [Acytostelium subglobosum LB1]|eukprot:XP_012754551.1 hypothetical protein SAMD00019534_056060 [Acytostelium subglobosum LB1]
MSNNNNEEDKMDIDGEEVIEDEVNEDVGETVPQQEDTTTTTQTTQTTEGGEDSSMLNILKSLKVGADLSKVTIPGGYILPKSTLTFFAENCSVHFDLLLACNGMNDPLQRMLQVYRYFLSTRWVPKEMRKKPLNPVLGETYELATHFKDEKHVATCLSEQISHHPPITSSIVYNVALGIQVSYNSPVKASFMGTYLRISPEGHFVVTLDKFKEVYSITLPPMALRIFRGFAELAGQSIMTCDKSDYSIKTSFFPKPLLFGNYNVIEATMYNGKEKIMKFKGQWDGEVRSSPYKKDKYETFVERSKLVPGTFVPLPAEKVLPTDSTIVWRGVIEAAQTQAGAKAITKEKTKVEEEQRRLAQERRDKAVDWLPAHFIQSKDGNGWQLKQFK